MQGVWLYALLLLAAGSCFGLTSPIVKIGYDSGLTVAQVTDAQYIVGLTCLWVIALFRRGKRGISKSQWWILLVLGLAGAGTSYSYYIALTYLPASLAIVLLFQFSWMVMLIDVIVTKKWPPLPKWIGLVLIFLGTVLAVGMLEEQSFAAVPVWAVLLGLFSGFCYAVSLYLSAYVDTEVSPFLRSAVLVTIATVVIFWAFPPTSLLDMHFWQAHWSWALLSGIVSQVLPVSLMLISIPRTGGRMAGVLGSIELPVAVLGARVILGESVSLLRWSGVILILAGIVVSEMLFEQKFLKFQRKTI